MNPLTLGYAETTAGPVEVLADAPTLRAWDATTGAWSMVTMQARYSPIQRRDLPERGSVNAGDTVALPAPEASALVAACYATAAAGTPTQAGVWTP